MLIWVLLSSPFVVTGVLKWTEPLPLQGHTNAALPYVVYIAVLLTNSATAALILPETKNRPLPDTMPEKGWKKLNRKVQKCDAEEPMIWSSSFIEESIQKWIEALLLFRVQFTDA